MAGIVKVCAIIRSEDIRVKDGLCFGVVSSDITSNAVRDFSLNHHDLQSAGAFQVLLKDVATIPTVDPARSRKFFAQQR